MDEDYLRKLKILCQEIQPEWISDHLCWTSAHGENIHDLLPLPFTRETAQYIAERILRVQDYLGRRMLFENVSSYLTFGESEMTEWEFISEIIRQADCGVLLDINNIYVSSVNHRFDPVDFLNGIPHDKVGQFHLAGHLDLGSHLIDTHDHPICGPVWDLYEKAVRRFGPIATLLERDDHIPEFSELSAELDLAKRRQEKALESSKSAPAQTG